MDVTSRAAAKDTGNGVSAAWGDYDNDGDLDLYKVSPSKLFRNDGRRYVRGCDERSSD